MGDDVPQLCCEALDVALRKDFVRRGRGRDVWLVGAGGARLMRCPHCPMCGRPLSPSAEAKDESFVVVLCQHRDTTKELLLRILREVFGYEAHIAIERAIEIRERMMAIAAVTDHAHAEQLAAQAVAVAEAAGGKLLLAVRKATEFEDGLGEANVHGKGSAPDMNEVIDVELTDRERKLLSWGVIEWGGPARCTEEMAVAMGFASVEEIFRHGDVLREWIKSATPMRRFDWLRSLLLTEIVFASQVIGSGSDWPITPGIPDQESLTLLRSIQRKLGPTGIYSLVRAGLGTRRRK